LRTKALVVIVAAPFCLRCPMHRPSRRRTHPMPAPGASTDASPPSHAAGGVVYVGGGFTAVNGSSTFQRFAAFSGASAVDGGPPTAPADLTASAPSSGRVDLIWRASNDDVGVTAYDVYRHDAPSPVASAGSLCGTSDAAVEASTQYRYVVRARDAATHASQPSNEATITTPAAGTPITVTPDAQADAMVKEGNAGANVGTSTALRVDAGTDPDVEAYLRFTIAGLSGDGPVESAVVRVWATSPTNDGPAAYATSDGWSESGAGSITGEQARAHERRHRRHGEGGGGILVRTRRVASRRRRWHVQFRARRDVDGRRGSVVARGAHPPQLAVTG
jgi:hypothetical protein